MARAAKPKEEKLEKAPENKVENKEDKAEVLESNKKASVESQTEETTLAEEALEKRDETLELAEKPFDSSLLYKQRAVLDTSGTAGSADHDMRRAYAVHDVDALRNQEVPEHLAKFVVSDVGAPATLKREEEARKDMPSDKKSKK